MNGNRWLRRCPYARFPTLGRSSARGALVLCALVAAACGDDNPGRSTLPVGDFRCRGCNVLLVSVDTLRADRMSLYGHQRPTTPFLDRLAEDAVVFDSFVANGGGTLPSHMTMMTSLHPRTHRVTDATRASLGESWTTLAEVLRSHGYATAAFTDGGWMNGDFGFSRGFDHYRDAPEYAHLEGLQPVAEEWIENHREEPFFLFLHTYDVHSARRELPYECPGDTHLRWVEDYQGDFDGCLDGRCASELLAWLTEGAMRGELDIGDHLTPEDVELVTSLYDGCVRYVDDRLAELVGRLQELGIYDRTLVVVTSDHGEEFLDHGLLLHHRGGFEEILRVPLIVKLPGSTVRGLRVDSLAAMVDLLPTILDVLDVPVPAQAQGASLAPAIVEGSTVRRAAHANAVLRTDRWKYFAADGTLYDLRADPGETRDVAASHPELAERLDRHLRRLLRRDEELRDHVTVDSEVTLTSEELAGLESLGYLQ